MFFSVIIPIFRVEKYLERCIESVLNQTFKDYEIILVDDGSDDNCPQICDEYEKKDSRIKVIHKKNGGLVSARQAGIKVAQGEYIINLDSDDAVISDYFENAKRIISETKADVIFFRHQLYIDGKIEETQTAGVKEGLYKGTGLEKELFSKLLCDSDMQHIYYFLCGKVFRRTLITEHQLNVSTTITIGEDLSCLVPCLLDAEKVYVSNKNAYLYTVRNDSLSTVFNTRQLTQLYEVVETLKKIKTDRVWDFYEQISRYSAYMCFAILAAAAEGACFESLKEIKKLILSLHLEEIKKAKFKNITLKTKISIKLMKKGFIRTVFVFLSFCGIIKKLKQHKV